MACLTQQKAEKQQGHLSSTRRGRVKYKRRWNLHQKYYRSCIWLDPVKSFQSEIPEQLLSGLLGDVVQFGRP